MRTDLFDYDYPASLVAQEPPPERGGSRLMVIHRNPAASGPWEHQAFSDLPHYLRADDVLVLNDTKVLPARLFADGFEILLLPPLMEDGIPTPCLIRPMKRAKPGLTLQFSSHLTGELVKVGGDGPNLIQLKLYAGGTLSDAIAMIGLPPLPPYIKRGPGDPRTPNDKGRYQTVFAAHPGSAAAPTAGLHFSSKLLDEIKSLSIRITYITLHVGWDTFRPVRSTEIEAHSLHGEDYCISEEAAAALNEAKQSGRRIIACGTTTARCLESAWDPTTGIRSGGRSTRLFIRPGSPFHVIDGLLTNFHQPRSTLLMMVSAFAGRDTIMAAYEEAIRLKYRLFSYGDAMFIA